MTDSKPSPSSGSATPGPWTFDEHGGTFYVWGPGMAMVADGDADEGYIARMRGVGRGATAEEQRANAALTAAAPELLEALKHERWCRACGEDGCANCNDCTYESALRKAEGHV